MNVRPFMCPGGAVLLVLIGGLPALAANEFSQTNLVSDQAGQALTTDSDLVNAWGISEGPHSLPIQFWISDNGTGFSTLYSVPASGPPSATKQALVVTIPSASAGTTSAPTGQVFNSSSAFGGAHFLFDSEDGVISGWSGGTSAVVEINNSANAAVYKGLAITGPSVAEPLIFATNFHTGAIEAYNGSFKTPTDLKGSFRDPNLPSGYAPFNDRVFGSELYVTYALQDSDKHDDVAGSGNGFVDVFNLDGTLKRRLISQGALNSPWGLAIAPAGFGPFGGDLLVGNFGDGKINAYNAATGQPLGTLDGTDGNPLVIDGLWGLTFGNDSAVGGGMNTLFFTAGPDGENHGLFGSLTAVPEPSTWAMLLAGFAGLGWAAMRRRAASFAAG